VHGGGAVVDGYPPSAAPKELPYDSEPHVSCSDDGHLWATVLAGDSWGWWQRRPFRLLLLRGSPL